MEKHAWELFRGEIQKNCDFALLAYNGMMQYSSSRNENEKTTSDRVWMSVESFLIAAANISKILWPSRPPKCSNCQYQPELETGISLRGTQLRSILSVKDDSPLGKRDFRNFFEHYDFQLENWLKQVDNQPIYDSNIGPIESVIRNSSKSLMIRHFDQYKSIIYFRGKEYHVNPVVNAIKELKSRMETNSI